MFNFEKDRTKHSNIAELINVYIATLFALHCDQVKVIEIVKSEQVWKLFESLLQRCTPEREIPLICLIMLQRYKEDLVINPELEAMYKKNEEVCIQGIKDFYFPPGIYQI